MKKLDLCEPVRAFAAVTAVLLLLQSTNTFAQARRIPARLVWYMDERPYGQLYTFSSADAGCQAVFNMKLANSYISRSSSFTDSCGTFVQTNSTSLSGAPYWTFTTPEGAQCNIPTRITDSLTGPTGCGYWIGDPRGVWNTVAKYPWIAAAYVCPGGDYLFDPSTKTCLLPYAEPFPPKLTPKCANPVSTGSGCKVETVEIESIRTGTAPIRLELRYAALFGRRGGRLVGNESWFLEPLDRRLLIPVGPILSGTKISALRPDGDFDEFTLDATGTWTAPNVLARLEAAGSGWRVIDFDARTLETYDSLGRLQEFSRFDGSFIRVAYESTSSYWPVSVESSIGVQYQIQRGSSGIARITGPDSIFTVLDYSTPTIPGLTYGEPYLTTVTFRDGAQRSFAYTSTMLPGGLALTDTSAMGSLRLYQTAPPFSQLETGADMLFALYGRAPMVLTSINDEFGRPFANFAYDDRGRATLSEHIGGVGRYTFSYPSTLSTVVTEPLGATNNFSFQTYGGRNLLSGITRQGPSNLYRGFYYYYDTGGNLRGLMSNTGNVTHCINTDPVLGKETARVEGMPYGVQCTFDLRTYTIPAGTIQRKVLTDWNAEWRLPSRRSEPKKLTTWTYHGQGGNCAPATLLSNGKAPPVLCSISEQATSDENGGLGLTATTVGALRTWTFSYTTYGRIASITDPNGKVTQYTHYADNHTDVGKRGNIASVTNAVNHTTQITDYAPNGQPTRVVDANGQATIYGYDARQRLTSQTAGTEQTRFDYDLAGQLVRVTLPDGAQLTYTYDAAHRLTEVADHRGNRLTYTLDLQGNRVGEKVTDPAGTLVRDVARVVDAFSQVKQLTGVQ
jgi:YD repeat-containing protein